MSDLPGERVQGRVQGSDRWSGLPSLEGFDDLAELLTALETADRANARATELIARFHATGEVEDRTGLPVETWLLAAGATASDRRMLATAATQLGRLPSLRDAFDAGQVSWAQVRAACLAVERLPDHLAVRVDDVLAGELGRMAGCDPDELRHVIDQAVASLEPGPEVDEVARAERASFISFQPRLDGTGAKVYGDLDGLGYGLVSASLDAGRPLGGRTRDHVAQHPDPARLGPAAAAAGRHRAARLVQLAADDLARRAATGHGPAPAGVDADHPAVDADRVDPTRALAPDVTLLMTVDQLLGRDDLPVGLIAAVTGGRLKVAAPTARAWLDAAEPRLRTIVLDETGEVLGVGRRQRFARGWLRDTIEAIHATCAAPGCRTAARVCDVDHQQPWQPRHDADRRGRTDLRELQPVCGTDHGAKDRDGWQVAGYSAGRRRWHHPRSGLSIDTSSRARLDAAARPRPPRAPLERQLYRYLARARRRAAPDPGGTDPPNL